MIQADQLPWGGQLRRLDLVLPPWVSCARRSMAVIEADQPPCDG